MSTGRIIGERLGWIAAWIVGLGLFAASLYIPFSVMQKDFERAKLKQWYQTTAHVQSLGPIQGGSVRTAYRNATFRVSSPKGTSTDQKLVTYDFSMSDTSPAWVNKKSGLVVIKADQTLHSCDLPSHFGGCGEGKQLLQILVLFTLLICAMGLAPLSFMAVRSATESVFDTISETRSARERAA